MADRGYAVELSGAGRIGAEIIRSLGGIRLAFLIKCVDLVEFLNSLAHTSVETLAEDTTDKRVRVGNCPATPSQGVAEMHRRIEKQSG
jgi:hypothetical protein